MATLDFKITATYKELQDAIKELDKFEEKIKKLNSANLDFEHLNKQMEKFSKTVDEKMQKFTELSMNNAPEVSAEATAYRDLDDAVNSVLGTQAHVASQLARQQGQLSVVRGELSALAKIEREKGGLDNKNIANKTRLIQKEAELKQSISELNISLKASVKQQQAAQGSMEEMSLLLGA